MIIGTSNNAKGPYHPWCRCSSKRLDKLFKKLSRAGFYNVCFEFKHVLISALTPQYLLWLLVQFVQGCWNVEVDSTHTQPLLNQFITFIMESVWHLKAWTNLKIGPHVCHLPSPKLYILCIILVDASGFIVLCSTHYFLHTFTTPYNYRNSWK